MRIRYSSEIASPPEVVFPWIAEPEKAMQWQKNVKGGGIIIEKPEIIGTTFKETIEEGGNTLEMQGVITEYKPKQFIGFHLKSRIHEFDVRYLVEEAQQATKLSIELDINWKFPMNIMSLFIGKKMEASLINQINAEVLELKKLCKQVHHE
jgi:hypothetical protein